MNIYLKRCKECGRGFDIGINFDVCPDCRKDKLKEVENGGREKEVVR